MKRSREWAIRCVHEASLNDVNCFLTLTYDDDHVPAGLSLFYPDFQAFMKRLRARFSNVRVRFYMCGEYGDNFDRPHYHALLFGFDFLDKVPLSISHRIYKFNQILWTQLMQLRFQNSYF